jgi:drug/metabolite transporter, DME family
MPPNQKTRRGRLLIVIAAVFYGTVVVGGEFFINKGFSLFEVALYPILLMTLAVLPVLFVRPQYVIPARLLPFFVLYGLIGAFAEFGQFVGLVFRVPVAVVALVVYTQPLWTVLLSAGLLGERITWRKISATLLAFAGVAVLSQGAWTLAVNHPLAGVLACLCASIFISLWVIWGRKSGISEQHYVTTTFGWGAFTALWLLALWPLLHLMTDNRAIARFSINFPIKVWGYLFLFAIIGGIIPSFCFFRGLRVIEASVAGIILLLEPVSAAVLAIVLFHQSIDTTIVLGGSLILLSNYVISGESAPSETSDLVDVLDGGKHSPERASHEYLNPKNR